jgi:SAM-dependent methyltransferase
MTQVQAIETGERAASHPTCPVCSGRASARFLFERSGLAIYRCARCRLEFQFPQPSDQELAAIYSSGYFLGSKDSTALDNQRTLKRATAKLYLRQLAAAMPAAGRLLEIGCGHGEFLLEAQARGFQVEGLEYSTHAASEANAQLGRAAVRVGSPELDRLPLAAYDVIAAFDVIEHLRDPLRALQSLSAALRPGGFIAIVTPSLDSWSRRLLGRYWMEYKAEHLTYFSRKSLRRILDHAGFQDIRFAPNYKVLNLQYIAAHFERFPIPILTQIVRTLNGVLPSGVRLLPFHVVASGVMATARRSAVD